MSSFDHGPYLARWSMLHDTCTSAVMGETEAQYTNMLKSTRMKVYVNRMAGKVFTIKSPKDDVPPMDVYAISIFFPTPAIIPATHWKGVFVNREWFGMGRRKEADKFVEKVSMDIHTLTMLRMRRTYGLTLDGVRFAALVVLPAPRCDLPRGMQPNMLRQYETDMHKRAGEVIPQLLGKFEQDHGVTVKDYVQRLKEAADEARKDKDGAFHAVTFTVDTQGGWGDLTEDVSP